MQKGWLLILSLACFRLQSPSAVWAEEPPVTSAASSVEESAESTPSEDTAPPSPPPYTVEPVEEVPFRHGLSLFGELKYPRGFAHFQYVNPKAPKGGILKQAVIGTFDNLNPFLLRGVAASETLFTFDTLLTASADEPSSAYGLLADGVRVDPENLWVEFHLDPKARWQDDTPVTAEDIVFSFTALREKGHPYYQSYYADIQSVEAVDPTTVRFRFKHEKNRELPLILGQLPILPKAFFDTHPFDKPGLTVIPSSGPYRVDRINPGRSVTLKRRENYWARNHPVIIGRHNFDRLQFDYYRDESVAVEALKAGAYDSRTENISRLWATAYNNPAAQKGLLKKHVIPTGQPAGAQGFFFNTRLPKFQDRRVRKALNLAFDFEWANKHLFYGLYQRTLSYFANSPYAAAGLPSPAEEALLYPYRDQLPTEVFTHPLTLPVSDGSGYIRTPLLEARDLLKQAGWVIRDFTLVHEKTGEPMTVEFLLYSTSFQRAVAPYLKNLAQLGIQGRIRMVDTAQYQKRMEQFDYELLIHIYPQSLSPGNEQMNYWSSASADVRGSLNVAGVKNPVIDALLEKILHAESQQALEVACRSLDRALWHEYYMVPHWYSGKSRIIHWDKFGYPEQPPAYGTGFFDTWWWDEAKARRIQEGRR